MISSQKYWKNQFLVCLGLFIAAAFCMKWMENDFWVNGEKFTIMGLELFYPKEKVMAVLAGLDDHVGSILVYHLHFDFVFMTGVFPGIAALCMMAKEKTGGTIKKILLAVAFLQIAAWGADVYENLSLLHWMKDPVIGDEFILYHFIVATKWIIALTGALSAIIVLVFIRKKS
ncbi:MAG: hypothetical protein JNN00_12935 [Chitinophagaceae bacterium]|nr:hypothetical protein [Chitinophagaceae bacterium]